MEGKFTAKLKKIYNSKEFLNFSDIDGVLKRANSSEYGLASGVFTKDINTALKFSEKLEAGTVFINTYNKTGMINQISAV